ncbi:MAG: double-strand break repair helicase AddA [bacterium]|nr:double-strand break repair helicase AddA [bacterium]
MRTVYALSENQLKARDPSVSVWVEASAGSGKTKLLIDRLLRLLLTGSPPGKILCITFTKAAASEMEERLLARLQDWAQSEDSFLKEELEAILGRSAQTEEENRARSLLLRVLDDPRGLKFQTLHAFCQSLLQSFPLEAELIPGFKVLDDTESRPLLQLALQKVLESQPQDMRRFLVRTMGTLPLENFVQTYVRAWGEGISSWEVSKDLNLDPGTSVKSLRENFCQGSSFPREHLLQAAKCLEEGGRTDLQRSQALSWWCQKTPDDRAEFALEYASNFLTKTKEIRQRLVTAKLVEKSPELLEILETEAQRIQRWINQETTYQYAESSNKLMDLGQKVAQTYKALKEEKSVLDYDDLIACAANLLENRESAPWVLYKLDGGVHHVLLDEAQDTSPAQWRIIKALTQEFFVGKTAQYHNRTLFVVGDGKQSIYSFQGADVSVFRKMRAHFIQTAPQQWRQVQLNRSYRSSPAVLKVVDSAFEPEKVCKGVQERRVIHEAFREKAPGCVEVWPLEKGEPEEGSNISGDVIASQKLANNIAQKLKHWIETREVFPSLGRPLAPGDIMILVQRRNHFLYALIRALKNKGVPVAGVDRLQLSEQLAIQDLIALGRFLLMPSDDKSFFQILLGPLFRLGHQDLYEISARRGKQSLWQAFKDASQKNEYKLFQPVVMELLSLLGRVDYSTPFEFFSSLLEAQQGRQRFLSVFGHSVSEILDAFLRMVAQHEAAHPASLQGFLHWFDQFSGVVKREISQSPDEVQVRTVHSAKGLQSPLVILPDSVRIPKVRDSLIRHEKGMAWMPPSKGHIPQTRYIQSAHQERIEQEYRRLLYVAMTRAENHLIVSGWSAKEDPEEGCWYDVVTRGLNSLPNVQMGQEGDLVFQENFEGVVVSENSANKKNPPLHKPLPAWASQVFEDKPEEVPLQKQTTQPRIESLEKGSWIHLLLEHLPRVSASQRRALARRLLSPSDVDAVSFELIYTEVSRLLENPTLQPLWASNARYEVPILGKLEGISRNVRLDYLAVTSEHVHVVDYKTDATPASQIQQISSSYIQQMAEYVFLLEQLYPNHTIKASILWTHSGVLQDLPLSLVKRYSEENILNVA